MDLNTIETTRMSTKVQVVIPEDIRDNMCLDVGTQFIVLSHGDTVLLKKIGRPSPGEIRQLFAESHRHAKKMGFKKSDVQRAIRDIRSKK